MQLSDIFKDTDAIKEAIEETKFQKRLKRLDGLPDWKKKEIEKAIKANELTLEEDLVRIFCGEDEI